MDTPMGDLMKRFGEAASKPGSRRSENHAELMTDRGQQRTNGAADDNKQNDVFHGRRGRKVASY